MEGLLFYPIYLLLGVIATLLLIPRKDYKEYFIYGFILGGLGDIVSVGLYQNLLGFLWFKNLGLFNVLGQHALSPPSWTVTMMLFLRFLPERRILRYIYIIAFAGHSVGYGYLVKNVGLFDFKPWLYPIVAYLIFLSWWAVAAWIFRKTSPLVNTD